jgi:hypothetical protein
MAGDRSSGANLATPGAEFAEPILAEKGEDAAMIEQPQTAMVKLLRLYAAGRGTRPELPDVPSWESFTIWAEQRAAEDEDIRLLYEKAQQESAVAFQRDHYCVFGLRGDKTLLPQWFPRTRG